jgi:predicted Zn-dependent protease
LRKILALVLALCLLIAPVARAEEMTVEEEIKIGRDAFKEVRAQLPMVDDPDTVSYIKGLAQKLTSARPDERYDYRFYVADEGVINAFALPGGWIVLFRGLITSMENEGELVGVMAHEMSHVYYRHIAARIKKSGAVSMATVAGMVAGLLLGALGGSPELGQALTLGSAAGGAQAQLAFSREDEMQADYGAYKVLTAAGYHPGDMARTFQRMWRTQRTTSPTPPTYLLTHPTSPDRMEAIQNLVRRYPRPPTKYDNSDFLRIKTRLSALYSPEDEAESTFKANLAKNSKDQFALYGQALLAMRRSKFREALSHLTRLDPLWQFNQEYLWRAQGICRLNLGDYEQAEKLLDKCLTKAPDDQEARVALGQTYLRQNKYEDAIFVLARVVSEHPDDAQAHYDLGMALGRQGNTAEASLHLGLAFKQGGKIKTARYHLERAVQGLNDRPELKKQAQKALDDISPKRPGQKKAENKKNDD